MIEGERERESERDRSKRKIDGELVTQSKSVPLGQCAVSTGHPTATDTLSIGIRFPRGHP